jgi:hypothetical protein
MAKVIEPVLGEHYREAVLLVRRHMLDTGPPTMPPCVALTRLRGFAPLKTHFPMVVAR